MAGDESLISRVADNGGRLRLRFVRLGDRVHHTVEWLDPAMAATALIESREGPASAEQASAGQTSAGQASDNWPASPPLQQLLIEPRGAAGHVALLVGMAGRSHWSLSIEPLADRVGFRFDAACRIGGPPEWLGHTWRIIPGSPAPVSPGSQASPGSPVSPGSQASAGSPASRGSPAEETGVVGFRPAVDAPGYEARFDSGCLRIVAEDGAECFLESSGMADARIDPMGESPGQTVETIQNGSRSSECRVRATSASAMVATGRFPATVQWRFVIAWVPSST